MCNQFEELFGNSGWYGSYANCMFYDLAFSSNLPVVKTAKQFYPFSWPRSNEEIKVCCLRMIL
jgi:hypothetical protein